jgi:hypothetical protein
MRLKTTIFLAAVAALAAGHAIAADHVKVGVVKVAAYHNAFIGPDEKRRDGPDAAATRAIISKYVGQSAEQLRAGISSIYTGATLDVADIQRQLAWFKAQGMVKPEVRDDQVYDKRYVVPLAAP